MLVLISVNNSNNNYNNNNIKIISKTAALVGCSRSAVVSIYQKWSKEGTVVTLQRGHGHQRLIGACGEQRLAHVVRSNRKATVAQIAEEVNAGCDGKMSEYTVHWCLLRMGLHSCRPVRVPTLTCVHCRNRQQWAREHQNWTTEQWKKLAWSDESRFLWHQDALWEEGKLVEAVWCFWQCSAGNPWVLPFMWTSLWNVQPTSWLLQTMYTLSWNGYTLIVEASFSRIMGRSTKQ